MSFLEGTEESIEGQEISIVVADGKNEYLNWLKLSTAPHNMLEIQFQGLLKNFF